MSIKGYRYISLPVHESELISHQIYLKEHNDKKNPGRVLFLGNVDVLRFLSIEEVDKLVKGLFKRFGTIEAITLSDISDDARFAHVLFEKKGSLKLALQASDDEYIEIWKELGKKMGLIITASSLQRSVAQVARMYSLKLADCDALKEEVDEYMTAFEGREVQQNLEHKAAAEAVDDDGFQIVSTK